MENHLPKSLSCPICYEVYDEQMRMPIIIPCGNGHTICATCVVNTWGEDGKFACPFDKVELQYYDGIVNELAKNRVVLDALEELKRDYCPQHQNRKLDLICHTCQSLICSACQLRGSHERHEIVLIEEFNEEVEKGARTLRQFLADIDKIFEKIISVVNQRQTVLHEIITNKFRLYGDKLKNSKEALKQQIEYHFLSVKEEINAHLFDQESKTQQILAWKSKAKEIATSNSRKKSVDDDFEIIKQSQIATSLEIQKWLDERKQNIKKLETKLEEMWRQFETELESSIHREEDLKARYDTFMDTVNAEVTRECESPTKIIIKKEIRKKSAEPRKSGSSTPSARKTWEKAGTPRNQEVKNFERFVQSNKNRGNFVKLSKVIPKLQNN